MKKTVLLVVVSVLVSFLMAYAGVPDDKAKELFEARCSVCHNPDYATGTSNTAEQWRTTVMRMKNENGASITEEEAETIIDYLSRHHGK